MRKLALIITASLLCGMSFAQKVKKEVVYLKNGSVVKGRLVELDDKRMIVQSARNTWVFNRTDIDTTTSSPVRKVESVGELNWFAKASVGVLVGSADNEKEAPFSFDFSANMKVLPKLYAGLGAGVDFFEESYMPVFGNLEYHFRKSRITPFVGMSGGYMVPLDGDIKTMSPIYYSSFSSMYYPYRDVTWENKGGLMLNPSIGFVSSLNENLGLSLSFGYRYSRVVYKGESQNELETNYNRLSIRIGILFN